MEDQRFIPDPSEIIRYESAARQIVNTSAEGEHWHHQFATDSDDPVYTQEVQLFVNGEEKDGVSVPHTIEGFVLSVFEPLQDKSLSETVRSQQRYTLACAIKAEFFRREVAVWATSAAKLERSEWSPPEVEAV